MLTVLKDIMVKLNEDVLGKGQAIAYPKSGIKKLTMISHDLLSYVMPSLFLRVGGAPLGSYPYFLSSNTTTDGLPISCCSQWSLFVVGAAVA